MIFIAGGLNFVSREMRIKEINLDDNQNNFYYLYISAFYNFFFSSPSLCFSFLMNMKYLFFFKFYFDSILSIIFYFSNNSEQEILVFVIIKLLQSIHISKVWRLLTIFIHFLKSILTPSI